MLNGRRLLFDVTRLIWRRWVGRLPTGIDRVCLAYLQHYRKEAQAVVHWHGYRRILPERASDRLFKLLLSPSPHVRRDLALFFVREQMSSNVRLNGRDRIFLNVGHTALQKAGFVEWTRTSKVRPVYLIHDLIPITHPEYCRAGEADRHTLRVRNMLASAVGIIANSEATRESFAAFANHQSMPIPAVIAAPLGTEIERRVRSSEVAPHRPTFVMLGTIEGRKNHLLMLQIWARLVRSLGMDAPRLLVIGQRGWESEQVFDMLDRSEVLRGFVEEVEACSDRELAVHLRSARALLFPSLIEGYGLPLVEALASGTPVIASNLTVFEEIGQQVPDFIDPLDGPAWQAAILDYADARSQRRQDQMTRLAQYRPPRWKDHFARVDKWLGTL